MKFLIVGAGAVGGFYGGKLALGGEDVLLLARGKTLDVLRERPLRVRSFQGDFQARIPVVARLQPGFSADVIVIAVKSYDTDGTIECIRPAVGPKTILMSFQNGVENERKLQNAFGTEKVLGALCYIGAEVVEPGIILHSAYGSVAVGEWDGARSERVRAVINAFEKSLIDVRLSENIQNDLWTKLAWNTAFNQVCTIARADVGAVLDSSELSRLLEEAMWEVVTIAGANGVAIPQDMVAKSMNFSRQELRSVKPSMLQDFEKGKRLEHETFSGFLTREGARLKRPVPVNATLYKFLCFLDARRKKS